MRIILTQAALAALARGDVLPIQDDTHGVDFELAAEIPSPKFPHGQETSEQTAAAQAAYPQDQNRHQADSIIVGGERFYFDEEEETGQEEGHQKEGGEEGGPVWFDGHDFGGPPPTC